MWKCIWEYYPLHWMPLVVIASLAKWEGNSQMIMFTLWENTTFLTSILLISQLPSLLHKIYENNWSRYCGTKSFFLLDFNLFGLYQDISYICMDFCMICLSAPILELIFCQVSHKSRCDLLMPQLWLILTLFRSACKAKRSDLRVLSGALPGHNLHHQAASKNLVLLLQPDSSLRAHRLHGCSWLHPPTRLGREAFLGWETSFSSQLLPAKSVLFTCFLFWGEFVCLQKKRQVFLQ